MNRPAPIQLLRDPPFYLGLPGGWSMQAVALLCPLGPLVVRCLGRALVSPTGRHAWAQTPRFDAATRAACIVEHN